MKKFTLMSLNTILIIALTLALSGAQTQQPAGNVEPAFHTLSVQTMPTLLPVWY